jgi:uncharacterized coiled-coil protein SlyX
LARSASDVIAEQRAEIERLRLHIACAEGALEEMMQVAREAEAEIERLRAALGEKNKGWGVFG